MLLEKFNKPTLLLWVFHNFHHLQTEVLKGCSEMLVHANHMEIEDGIYSAVLERIGGSSESRHRIARHHHERSEVTINADVSSALSALPVGSAAAQSD